MGTTCYRAIRPRFCLLRLAAIVESSVLGAGRTGGRPPPPRPQVYPMSSASYLCCLPARRIFNSLKPFEMGSKHSRRELQANRSLEMWKQRDRHGFGTLIFRSILPLLLAASFNCCFFPR
ncbi:hypothetical protein BJ912DRAFT_326936 [Pholiota molesta]|nr:hypothetical protein BJ912DRAFT_326936 [Pholiota molesta]